MCDMWNTILKKISFLKQIYGECFLKLGTTLSNEGISPNEFIVNKLIFKDIVENPWKFLAVLDPPPSNLGLLFLPLRAAFNRMTALSQALGCAPAFFFHVSDVYCWPSVARRW